MSLVGILLTCLIAMTKYLIKQLKVLPGAEIETVVHIVLIARSESNEQ